MPVTPYLATQPQPAPVGRVFYVGTSSATTGVSASDTGNGTLGDPSQYGTDPFYPFATINYCVSYACVAGRGDTIYVLPGTAITVSAAAGVALSTAGVRVVGMGIGATAPVVTFTTATTATVTMTAAGCSFENFTFTGNMNALASMIVVSAADCAIKGCTFNLVTGSNYTLIPILTTASANRLIVDKNRFLGNLGTTARHTNAVKIVGGDGISITNNLMTGAWEAATGAVSVATTPTTNLLVTGNLMRGTTTASETMISDAITASTGYIDGNRFQILQSDTTISGATFAWGLNYYAATLGTVFLIGV